MSEVRRGKREREKEGAGSSIYDLKRVERRDGSELPGAKLVLIQRTGDKQRDRRSVKLEQNHSQMQKSARNSESKDAATAELHDYTAGK